MTHDLIGCPDEAIANITRFRGTRIRVSDILDMLAHGVSPAEILADHPCLGEADLEAALAFGAAASGHRITNVL